MNNQLNIQITITDEQMTDLIRGNLANLPEDKIQEIISDALKAFLKTENGQRLFYIKEYYSSQPRPTQLLLGMIENAVSKDLLKPCVDEFIDSIKGNYENLIKEAIVKTFSNLFLTELKEAILNEEIYHIIDQQRNQDN